MQECMYVCMYLCMYVHVCVNMCLYENQISATVPTFHLF